MKLLYIALLLVCTTTIAFSQEYKATFGKYTGCLRAGGICTITEPSSRDATTANVSFIQHKNGSTLLRIYKEQLSIKEQQQLQDLALQTTVKNTVEFVMEETLPLPSYIVGQTAKSKEKQLQSLEAKTYPVIITEKFIDIVIVDNLQ